MYKTPWAVRCKQWTCTLQSHSLVKIPCFLSVPGEQSTKKNSLTHWLWINVGEEARMKQHVYMDIAEKQEQGYL